MSDICLTYFFREFTLLKSMKIIKRESKLYPAQVNIPVTKEMKLKLTHLKHAEGVQIHVMLRERIDEMVLAIEEQLKAERTSKRMPVTSN